jgi:ABC-type transporter Mla MlaB component
MVIWARPSVDFSVHGPVAVADLPGLRARLCAQLRERGIPVIVICDVADVQADAVAVDVLAQLHLCARRHDSRLQVQNASTELLELILFVGLADVFWW